MNRFVSVLLSALLSVPAMTTGAILNPDHPQQYVVVSGDTLWGISSKFLQQPWHWRDIWYANPQIQDPHLIYPGDTIALAFQNDQPALELTRGPTPYKMSPTAHEIMLEHAIPTIPLDAVLPFLNRPLVVGEETLAAAPYIVASVDQRLLAGAGDKVYVRGIDDEDGKHHSVFRQGSVYMDPETDEILGYEAIYIADAWVAAMGDPATVYLRHTAREVVVGDRLLPVVEDDYEISFIPRPPPDQLNGYIISVVGGGSQIGRHQIIVLNKGRRDNLQVGHVVSVHQVVESVIDPILSDREDEDYFNLKNNNKDRNVSITLPDEYAGVAMIFKILDKVSYGIVMKASRVIYVGDKVSTPK